MHTHLIRTHSNSGWCYEPLLETVALESRPLFRVLRHCTPRLSDMPFRSDRVSPSPYREYSSYPAEGKVSFL